MALILKLPQLLNICECELQMQIVEIPSHPFFIGAQFHPEFKSRPGKPSPLFLGKLLPVYFSSIASNGYCWYQSSVVLNHILNLLPLI